MKLDFIMRLNSCLINWVMTSSGINNMAASLILAIVVTIKCAMRGPRPVGKCEIYNCVLLGRHDLSAATQYNVMQLALYGDYTYVRDILVQYGVNGFITNCGCDNFGVDFVSGEYRCNDTFGEIMFDQWPVDE